METWGLSSVDFLSPNDLEVATYTCFSHNSEHHFSWHPLNRAQKGRLIPNLLGLLAGLSGTNRAEGEICLAARSLSTIHRQAFDKPKPVEE